MSEEADDLFVTTVMVDDRWFRAIEYRHAALVPKEKREVE